MRLSKFILPIVLYTLATIIFLYPLPFHLGDRIFEKCDSYTNIWIMHWEWYSLFHSHAGFFNGNIYFPEAASLAFSELLLPILILFVPVKLLFENPLVAYNLTLLATFPLSALSMFALVKYLTGRFSPALIAGFIFGFTPIRLSHLHHIQLESMMLLPLLLLFFHRWLRFKRWRDAVLTGCIFAIQYLTSVYIALYAAPVLLIWFVLHFVLEKKWIDRRSVLQGLLALILALLILTPFLLPYRQLQSWDVMPPESLKVSLSSDLWTNLLASFPSNRLYGDLLESFRVAPPRRNAEIPSGGYERFYFSGFLIPILAALSLFYRKKQTVLVFIAVAVSANIIAMGPVLQVSGYSTGISMPYRWIYDPWPGLAMLRVPARAGLIAFAAITVLGAFGWMRLMVWQASPSRPRVFSEGLMTGIAVFLLGIEFFSAPLPLLPEVSGSRIPAVYHYLREYPGPGGIIELPVTGHNELDSEHNKRIYTYFSTYHFKPIVVGYSGYNPPTFGQLMAAGRALPSDEALDLLESIGVRSIVLHTSELPDGEIEKWDEAIASSRRLKPVVAYPDGSRLIAMVPVLHISQDLNDLRWEAALAEIGSNRTLSLQLRSLGMHSPDIDYVVNPQLPRPSMGIDRRVGTADIEVQWYESGNLILGETVKTRLPYLLNEALVELKLKAPEEPGDYGIQVIIHETPPLILSTEISIPPSS